MSIRAQLNLNIFNDLMCWTARVTAFHGFPQTFRVYNPPPPSGFNDKIHLSVNDPTAARVPYGMVRKGP